MKTFWQRRKWDVLGAMLALVIGGGLIGWNRRIIQQDKEQRTCMSQLRQAGLAMYQYIRDYDEKYPLTPKLGAGDPALLRRRCEFAMSVAHRLTDWLRDAQRRSASS
jgi:hypothetical protein